MFSSRKLSVFRSFSKSGMATHTLYYWPHFGFSPPNPIYRNYISFVDNVYYNCLIEFENVVLTLRTCICPGPRGADRWPNRPAAETTVCHFVPNPLAAGRHRSVATRSAVSACRTPTTLTVSRCTAAATTCPCSRYRCRRSPHWWQRHDYGNV